MEAHAGKGKYAAPVRFGKFTRTLLSLNFPNLTTEQLRYLELAAVQ